MPEGVAWGWGPAWVPEGGVWKGVCGGRERVVEGVGIGRGWGRRPARGGGQRGWRPAWGPEFGRSRPGGGGLHSAQGWGPEGGWLPGGGGGGVGAEGG